MANILNDQPQEPIYIETLADIDFEAPYGTLRFFATIVCPVCNERFCYSWDMTYLIHRSISCPHCLASILLTYDAFAACWNEKFDVLSKSQAVSLDEAIVQFAKNWFRFSRSLYRRLRVSHINTGLLYEYFIVLFMSGLAYKAVVRKRTRDG